MHLYHKTIEAEIAHWMSYTPYGADSQDGRFLKYSVSDFERLYQQAGEPGTNLVVLHGAMSIGKSTFFVQALRYFTSQITGNAPRICCSLGGGCTTRLNSKNARLRTIANQLRELLIQERASSLNSDLEADSHVESDATLRQWAEDNRDALFQVITDFCRRIYTLNPSSEHWLCIDDYGALVDDAGRLIDPYRADSLPSVPENFRWVVTVDDTDQSVSELFGDDRFRLKSIDFAGLIRTLPDLKMRLSEQLVFREIRVRLGTGRNAQHSLKKLARLQEDIAGEVTVTLGAIAEASAILPEVLKTPRSRLLQELNTIIQSKPHDRAKKVIEKVLASMEAKVASSARQVMRQIFTVLGILPEPAEEPVIRSIMAEITDADVDECLKALRAEPRLHLDHANNHRSVALLIWAWPIYQEVCRGLTILRFPIEEVISPCVRYVYRRVCKSEANELPVNDERLAYCTRILIPLMAQTNLRNAVFAEEQSMFSDFVMWLLRRIEVSRNANEIFPDLVVVMERGLFDGLDRSTLQHLAESIDLCLPTLERIRHGDEQDQVILPRLAAQLFSQLSDQASSLAVHADPNDKSSQGAVFRAVTKILGILRKIADTHLVLVPTAMRPVMPPPLKVWPLPKSANFQCLLSCGQLAVIHASDKQSDPPETDSVQWFTHDGREGMPHFWPVLPAPDRAQVIAVTADVSVQNRLCLLAECDTDRQILLISPPAGPGTPHQCVRLVPETQHATLLCNAVTATVLGDNTIVCLHSDRSRSIWKFDLAESADDDSVRDLRFVEAFGIDSMAQECEEYMQLTGSNQRLFFVYTQGRQKLEAWDTNGRNIPLKKDDTIRDNSRPLKVTAWNTTPDADHLWILHDNFELRFLEYTAAEKCFHERPEWRVSIGWMFSQVITQSYICESHLLPYPRCAHLLVASCSEGGVRRFVVTPGRAPQEGGTIERGVRLLGLSTREFCFAGFTSGDTTDLLFTIDKDSSKLRLLTDWSPVAETPKYEVTQLVGNCDSRLTAVRHRDQPTFRIEAWNSKRQLFDQHVCQPETTDGGSEVVRLVPVETESGKEVLGLLAVYGNGVIERWACAPDSPPKLLARIKTELDDPKVVLHPSKKNPTSLFIAGAQQIHRVHPETLQQLAASKWTQPILLLKDFVVSNDGLHVLLLMENGEVYRLDFPGDASCETDQCCLPQLVARKVTALAAISDGSRFILGMSNGLLVELRTTDLPAGDPSPSVPPTDERPVRRITVLRDNYVVWEANGELYGGFLNDCLESTPRYRAVGIGEDAKPKSENSTTIRINGFACSDSLESSRVVTWGEDRAVRVWEYSETPYPAKLREQTAVYLESPPTACWLSHDAMQVRVGDLSGNCRSFRLSSLNSPHEEFFDVFLSYKSCEQVTVSTLNETLTQLGAKVFQDRQYLFLGDALYLSLYEAIHCTSVFCEIRRDGEDLTAWQKQEVNIAKGLEVKKRLRKFIRIAISDRTPVFSGESMEAWIDPNDVETIKKVAKEIVDQVKDRIRKRTD
jgi:hypothetical protein